MAAFLPSRYSKVLEIGCGIGAFVENLSPHPKLELWGIEPQEESAQLARTKMNQVINSTFEESINLLPDKYFDLIICNDVIEHMKDYHLFFDTVKCKLHTEGVIVGSIPNLRFISTFFELLVKKDWRYREAGTLDRTHLRFFTEKSFKRVLVDHHFKIESFAGINSIFSSQIDVRQTVKCLVCFVIIFLTLGYYSDIQYVNFGFRIRNKEIVAASTHEGKEVHYR